MVSINNKRYPKLTPFAQWNTSWYQMVQRYGFFISFNQNMTKY